MSAESEQAAAAIVQGFGPWAIVRSIELRKPEGPDGYHRWLAQRMDERREGVEPSAALAASPGGATPSAS